MMSYKHSRLRNADASGAVLLALMLIIITASSFVLITRLNANIQIAQGEQGTRSALKIAKQALIGYAVTYPDKVNPQEGPGYLPCPDTNKDGISESDDLNADGIPDNNCDTAILRVGRLPYETLELEELRDSSGQRLWYVISDQFQNDQNKITPLNSESPSSAQLNVDTIGDIVAVIIAPGKPLDTQSRDSSDNTISTEISSYLEGDNADISTTAKLQSYVTTLGSSYDKSADGERDPSNDDALVFNDQLILITRQELMSAVEKRVLGEVSQILTQYNTTYGAYPWLTPFADPKAVRKNPSGSHDGGNGASSLIDTSIDFTDWGVAAGDIVRNITDGSIGTVSSVTSTTLTITGLSLGTDNDFDDDDEYYVYVNNLASVLSGTATSGSSSLTLEDSSNDFVELGIVTGDIIENITDGSSGIVDSVTANTITAESLTGGTNVFSNNDVYQVRSSVGINTDTDSNKMTLDDANKDFINLGILSNDLVINNTDGSFGRISAVATNKLTIGQMYFGTDNEFDDNDQYYIPRFNADSNTREGLLAFHEVGEPFKTDLTFDWSITADPGDISVTNSTLLLNYMQNYAASGSISFDNSNDDSFGACIWSVPDMADCYAYFKNFVSISGRLTSGSNTADITDSTAVFNTDGIKRGDIAQNYDDESSVITGTVDAGNSGTATADTDSNGLTLEDTSNNFTNVDISVGTTIFNTTDSSSGTITSVSANQITVSSLIGGTDNIFEVGDSYQIDGDPILYDASADFTVYERHSYVIQNNTLEVDLGVSKIQGVISDTIDVNTLVAKSYVGSSSTPIQFRPGDTYEIYQPDITVVTSVTSETLLSTSGYTRTDSTVSPFYPDYDTNEYYRVMPAANSYSGTVGPVTSTGATDTFKDLSANFVADGVSVGDIIENTTTGAFGEITAVIATDIETTLYNGSINDFTLGDSYTVYHDYVYSREHILYAKYRGNQGTNNVSQERVRDVCLGYSSDCSTTATAVNFSGNGGVPLITIRDYEEDEMTDVGTAIFTPSAASSGNIRVSNIDFYMAENNGDLPGWFLKNNCLDYQWSDPG